MRMIGRSGEAGRLRGWRRAALMLSVASVGLAAATAGLPPHRAFAQAPPAAAPVAAAEDGLLTQPQLEQLLAPVALYPDQLLMQMLMAATYPLEVVQAQRWLQQGRNAELRGEALAQALQAQSWDPSVKSLVPFPDVLAMMNDQLEWTQQLGDAVLGQQEDVLAAVQVLRGRAQAAGHLQSGPQQTVTVTQAVQQPRTTAAATTVVQPPPQVIVIQPAQPEVVYVPAYNPTVVYGSWPYPSYPPPYYPPPVGYGLGSALLTGMAFAGGMALVGSLWGWASPGWDGGNVNINANRYNNINVNRNQISGNTWRHDTTHRQGVAYRNQEVRDRYRGTEGGAAASDRAQSREQFRGRVDQADRGGSLADRGGAGDRGGLGDRGGIGDRQAGSAQRPSAADRGQAGGADRQAAAARPGTADRGTAGAAQRPSVSPAGSGRPQVQQRPAAPSGGGQAFQGVGNGGAERAAAQRGAASRQAAPRPAAASRPSGGGRAGGGRG